MSAPVHIMRWAPADYVNDPFVMLMMKRRAYRVLTFYSMFLFRSHMEGGSLPAPLDLLSAAVSMPSEDVASAVATLIQHGKITEAEGRLYHKRVVREIAKELSYRENQSGAGKKGGRPGKGTLSDTESPPSPSPSPSPAPSPERTDGRPVIPPGVYDIPERRRTALADGNGRKRNPLVADRDGLERESLALTREIAALTGSDPVEVMVTAARYEGAPPGRQKCNPANMSDDRLLLTVSDLRATLKAEQDKRRGVSA